MASPAIGKQEAFFWVNVYREMLAVDEAALVRMRALLTSQLGNGHGDLHHLDDVALVLKEVERVRRRLAHWSGLVNGHGGP